MNQVYILSGPAGVGKSTTARELVKQFSNSAYISGDDVSHMHKNGREKPWESKEEIRLIWENILCLTKNFLRHGNDVVIDYVTFPHEAGWLRDNLKEFDTEVMYVVLWTNQETLMKRDSRRDAEYRMGERCLILMNEFLESGLDPKHFLDTSNDSVKDIPTRIKQIINGSNYKL